MTISKRETEGRGRRARRIRKKLSGTGERPRLCVRRSLRHMYAQLVDDEKGVTIIQVGSAGKGFSAGADGKGGPAKTAVARTVGELLAVKAKEKGVTRVVFDRKGYRYHGRVKALADAARAKGLVF
ncbi:MAG: 50S ribosomal protein L18 [Chitinispirillaceae bacterium]|nr:50S ribosomal protein L18 [Chitinispirillaceae bacterium]